MNVKVRTEDEMLSELTKLRKQLSFASAQNLITETIIANDDTQTILQTMAQIIGSTLDVDRSLIYDMDFPKHQVIGLCEWLNPKTPNVTSSIGTYSRDAFKNGTDYMMETHHWLESHVDEMNPITQSDGSGELLHKHMHIKSGFWYPFYIRENGYYCLVFNQVNHRRVWTTDEINFISAVAKQVEIGIQKINFLTKQKQDEEKLRLSEERFSKAFNYSPISMSIHATRNGKFIDVNESCLIMHGYNREEFIGHSQETLNLWVDVDEQTKFLQNINEKGFAHNHETRIRKKSGEVFAALLSGVIVDLNGEQCILEIKTNITELRQYQKEIARLDRLNVIGQMAAGIAHEIRNPMTTVRGFLQILENNKNYFKDKTYFNLMIDELDRVNSIIIEFLSLAQHKSVDLEKKNLNTIITTISPLMQADATLTDSYINMNLGTIPELPLNEKEIRQLIINLVRNGIEAMPDGGYLTIKTYLGDNEVVMSVQDQGQGIDSRLVEKIGTPFFTTKDNGTGLGLATSFSIANRHNAKIEFKTSEMGTTFYIKFKNTQGL